MDNKNYKETLAKQEDLNWDGNTEQQQQEEIEYTYIVDEDRMKKKLYCRLEKLKKLIHDKS